MCILVNWHWTAQEPNQRLARVVISSVNGKGGHSPERLILPSFLGTRIFLTLCLVLPLAQPPRNRSCMATRARGKESRRSTVGLVAEDQMLKDAWHLCLKNDRRRCCHDHSPYPHSPLLLQPRLWIQLSQPLMRSFGLQP